MSLVSKWRNRGLACGAFLLACASSVSAEVVEQKIPDGQWKTWNSTPYANGQVTLRVYLGCMDATKQYFFKVNGSEASGLLPKVAFQVKEIVYQVSISQPVSTGTNFDQSRNYKVDLYTGTTLVDTQTVSTRISGKVAFTNATRIDWAMDPEILIFTMKPGGPASGKERINNNNLPAQQPPVDPGEVVDLFSAIPEFQTGVGGQPGSANTPTNFGIGGRQGTMNPGTNWHRVIVPGGSWPPAGVPSWVPGGGNAERGGLGQGKGVFWSPSLPPPSGDPPIAPTFFYGMQGGQMVVQGGTPENSLTVGFPAGYVPIPVDLREPAALTYDSTNLDPCFAAAADIEDIPPPGMGPGSPDPVLPPGVTPSLLPPTLPEGMNPGGLPGGVPGMTPGPGVPNPIMPGTPGNPGSGGGGGAGGGGVIQLPTDPGDPGKAPAQNGAALPGDNAGKADGDRIGKAMVAAMEKIQNAAKGFTGAGGTLTAPNLGQASTWTISLPFGPNHQNMTMTIPHQTAGIIRALLLLLLTGIFIVAIKHLLLG